MKPLYTEEQFIQSKYKDKLPLECKNCTSTFYKFKKEISQTIKGQGRRKMEFCSRQCLEKGKNPPIISHCKVCQKEISRIRSVFNANKNHFCSKSCSASYNNTLPRKRMEKKGKCKKCNTAIYSGIDYCFECRRIVKGKFFVAAFLDSEWWKCIKIKELSPKNRTTKNVLIRQIARKIFKKSNPKQCSCSNCGYNKHIEVCHIIALKDFDDERTLGEVNHDKNYSL